MMVMVVQSGSIKYQLDVIMNVVYLILRVGKLLHLDIAAGKLPRYSCLVHKPNCQSVVDCLSY